MELEEGDIMIKYPSKARWGNKNALGMKHTDSAKERIRKALTIKNANPITYRVRARRLYNRLGLKLELCEKCGKKLENKFTFHHFHATNGKKVFTVVSVCPDARFWNSHSTHKHGGYVDIGLDGHWLDSYFYENGKPV